LIFGIAENGGFKLCFSYILDYFQYILYNKLMRKLSVAGYGFFERLGPESSLRLVKDAGFDAIDYPLYDEGKRLLFDLGGGRVSLSFAKEMRSLAEDLGIVVGQTHAPFGYREDDGSTKDQVLDVYKRAAEATAALGAKRMVVHPIKFENCKFDFRREECFQLNLELFSRLRPFLKEVGVTALLENMFITEKKDGFMRLLPTIYSTGAELARAKDALGEEFGVCLDSGHAFITKEDIPEMVRAIGPRLLALHLHDNTGDRDDHLPPYFGKGKLDVLLSALKENGYQGNLNFEVRFTAVPQTELLTAMRYVHDVGVSFRRYLDGENYEKN